MNELEEKFYETGVVPVVVLEDAEDAVPLAQALVEGGLLSAEVTFRTAAASRHTCARGYRPHRGAGYRSSQAGPPNVGYGGGAPHGWAGRHPREPRPATQRSRV